MGRARVMTILVMALALAGWWAYENRARALSGPEVKLLD